MKRLKQKVLRYFAICSVVALTIVSLLTVAPSITPRAAAATGCATDGSSSCCTNAPGNPIYGSGYDAAKDPTCIPDSCPNGTQVTPKPFDCTTIPAGCPGSTAPNTATTQEPQACPYMAFTLQTEASSGTTGKYYCGSGTQAVAMSIDIGCRGQSCTTTNGTKICKNYSSILDATFAIIRFLSSGVGLVVIGSIILGGIQYSASRGDPKATAAAIGRIRSSVVALIIFIFGYAILNYIIPSGFFR
jgi:hypothetical protein